MTNQNSGQQREFEWEPADPPALTGLKEWCRREVNEAIETLIRDAYAVVDRDDDGEWVVRVVFSDAIVYETKEGVLDSLDIAMPLSDLRTWDEAEATAAALEELARRIRERGDE